MTYQRPQFAYVLRRDVSGDGEAEYLGRDGQFGAVGLSIAWFDRKMDAEAASPDGAYSHLARTEDLPGMAYALGLEQALQANPEGPLAPAIQAELDALQGE